ncbi:serine hydrolase [Alteriqipengyuania lutimaris]|uniref:Serine hydrolase n=1 Tax=Alteriqipengyuania lutimaris TaxID=1538146 RepID=A0A395LNL7_9SPHN|nr:serine hydrolase [Alteriqipengyuania lutimaris]MBB3032911.1 beta-lactamase class A [Alteriqipengyuania lutimaris]RDS78656.1 serine hydrolase [Alteriqipengyuania lutimaris]
MIRHAMLAIALASPMAAPAMAQMPDSAVEQGESRFEARAADVVAVLRGEKDAAEVFAPAFLAQVPATQLAQIGNQLTTELGPLVGVESVEPVNANRATVSLRFEDATAAGPLTLDPAAPFLVTGLLLNDIQQLDDGPTKISADMAALGGSAAAWFGPLDGEAIFAYGDPAKQYALGSTFKLYVLAALSRAVAEGRLSWADVVTLDAKSFPSGIMQDWPDGAPVTLHTAATLMISISDNTATDLVIEAVGREAIEAEMRASGHSDPSKSFPFLTTREMFAVKAGDAGMAYAAADEAGRRTMLETLDTDGLTQRRVEEVFASGTPVLIEEVEWFASMRDERALMRVLAALPDDTAREIMSISTALNDADEAGWSYVGYKGGSETGVLNMSWLLRDEAGRWHMLAISQMDPAGAVDTATLLLLARRILALARQDAQ